MRLIREQMLKVSSLHSIYIHEYGNPTGNPILFNHGGPGGATSLDDLVYFKNSNYRVILYDQRASGKSTPHASISLLENTTWDLVADIEKMRVHLGIDRWVVFGGSWGSTISLTYAITHPDRVKALVLRGIFLLRPAELKWFYQEGANQLFPDYWEHFLHPIPVSERGNLLAAYHGYLTGDDEVKQSECAKAWSKWECATSKLVPNIAYISKADESKWALAFARIEAHYFVNNGFFPTQSWILENVDKIKDIPGVIVQGRYDVVCPMQSAWDLHKAWQKASLVVMDTCGHSATEVETTNELTKAAESFQHL